MEEKTIGDRFEFTKKGIIVNVSKHALLPGVFMNILQAERAYDKFCAERRAAKYDRNSKKGN